MESTNLGIRLAAFLSSGSHSEGAIEMKEDRESRRAERVEGDEDEGLKKQAKIRGNIKEVA